MVCTGDATQDAASRVATKTYTGSALAWAGLASPGLDWARTGLGLAMPGLSLAWSGLTWPGLGWPGRGLGLAWPEHGLGWPGLRWLGLGWA